MLYNKNLLLNPYSYKLEIPGLQALRYLESICGYEPEICDEEILRYHFNQCGVGYKRAPTISDEGSGLFVSLSPEGANAFYPEWKEPIFFPEQEEKMNLLSTQDKVGLRQLPYLTGERE